MLHSLSEEIQQCDRVTEECACHAETASTEILRAYYLRRERDWLNLARSSEFQQRLALFGKESDRRQSDAGRGIALASRVDLAVGKTSVEGPWSSKTANDSEHRQTELIAIIDDEECARDGLSTLIESYGGRTATFASAQDYLAADQKENAGCLILDVHLPGMSGPDLHAHLLAEGRCPPTVFVTARFEPKVQKRVIAAGALGYFSKPCDAMALLDCVEKALGSTLCVRS